MNRQEIKLVFFVNLFVKLTWQIILLHINILPLDNTKAKQFFSAIDNFHFEIIFFIFYTTTVLSSIWYTSHSDLQDAL